jgi:predicted nucleic acid-binding protein
MVFVDTGGWIAAAGPTDTYHDVAKSHYERLLLRRVPLFTSNYVIDETMTRLRYDVGHNMACRFYDKYERAENRHLITTLWVDEEVTRQAWQIFRKYSDQKLSFTDCTSFALMQNNGIKETFAFDTHFEMFGFLRSLHS